MTHYGTFEQLMRAAGVSAPDAVCPSDKPEKPAEKQMELPGLPPFDSQTPPEWVDPPELERVHFAFSIPDNRVCAGVMASGGKGCGKSSAVAEYCRRAGIHNIVVACRKGMTADHLVGVTTLAGGKTIVEPGPITEAVEGLRTKQWKRVCVTLEEANLLDPGETGFLNPLCDRRFPVLHVPGYDSPNGGGQTIPVPHGLKFALLYNEGIEYAGTRPLNGALKDRLMPIQWGYLGAEQERAVLRGITRVDAGSATRIIGLARAIRALGEIDPNAQIDLSIRALARFTLRALSLTGGGERPWLPALRETILDMLGSPQSCGPIRLAVENCALNNHDLNEWPSPFIAADDADNADDDADADADAEAEIQAELDANE